MDNPLVNRAPDDRPARLDRLNDDVVLTIARMLFSFRDVLNLRLTCKALSNNLIEWFRTELPRFHHGRPGHVTLRLSSPYDVEKFNGFAKSELIAHQITHLRIDVAELTSQILYSFSHLSDGSGKMFLEDMRSNLSGVWDITEFNQFRSEDYKEARYHQYHQAYMEEQWMKSSGEHKKLFTEAFRKLSNLKEIVIGDWVDKRPELRANVRGRRITEKPTYPYERTLGCRARTAALSTILANLALHPKDLEKLIIQRQGPDYLLLNNEEAGIWAFDMPTSVFKALSASMGNLKKLHVTLSDGTFIRHDRSIYSVAPDGITTESGLRALIRFVSVLPVLESFSLAAAIDTLFPTTFIQDILRTLPRTLCRIHLFNIITTVTDLNKFFWERRAVLRSVGLTRVYLVGENWTPVFKLMKDHLLSLDILHFEQLWELSAAYSSWLYFPRNNCFGRSRNGRFIDGRWLPREGYDSLDCREPGVGEIDDYQRYRPYSIQRGLARVIWRACRDNKWSTAELAEYGTLPQRVVDHMREKFGERLEAGWDDTKLWELFGEC